MSARDTVEIGLNRFARRGYDLDEVSICQAVETSSTSWVRRDGTIETSSRSYPRRAKRLSPISTVSRVVMPGHRPR